MTDPHGPWSPPPARDLATPGPSTIGSANGAVPAQTSPRSIAAVLIWLGGADTGPADRQGRSAHAVTGTVVLLFAVTAGIAVALAGRAAHWPTALVVIATIVAALLVCAIARAVLSAPPAGHASGRGRRFGRLAVAALTGAVIAETAGTVVFGGPIDRTLDDRARRDAASAASVVTAGTALDAATAARTALGRTIAQAHTDIGQALIVARCEYHPTPECPQTKITGIPGRGPETRTANAMLDAARRRMRAAVSRVRPLDEQVTARRAALERARTAAVHSEDRGVGARWTAMNDYTTAHASALLLRLLILASTIALALVPALLRARRHEATPARHLDRTPERPLTRYSVTRADTDPAARTVDAEGDREHTRAITTIDTAEVPENTAAPENWALPPGPSTTTPTAARGTRTEHRETHGGLELPFIGTVPFSDTAARWILPLVPEFVSSAVDRTVDTATTQLRSWGRALAEAAEAGNSAFTRARAHPVTVGTSGTRSPDATEHPEYIDVRADLDPDIAAPQHLRTEHRGTQRPRTDGADRVRPAYAPHGREAPAHGG